VGYTLGLAPSTVATHLSSAMAKLGLRSRREVIAVLGPLARPGGGELRVTSPPSVTP
jgi:DNA-binding CsgD family transcriptional regulator